MALLTEQERVVLRVMAEMTRRNLSYVNLAERIGWSPAFMAMRLGFAMPGTKGGRVPLSRGELTDIAGGLRVPVAQLLTHPDRPAVDELEAIAS